MGGVRASVSFFFTNSYITVKKTDYFIINITLDATLLPFIDSDSFFINSVSFNAIQSSYFGVSLYSYCQLIVKLYVGAMLFQ